MSKKKTQLKIKRERERDEKKNKIGSQQADSIKSYIGWAHSNCVIGIKRKITTKKSKT